MRNRFSSKWLVLVCALAISFPASAETVAAEGDAVGIVKTKTGNVMVERGPVMQVLSVGSKVYQNDRVFTGRTSSVGITLNDDMRISLASSSSFKFTQFVYDPNTREGSFIGSVLKGSLRFVTGLLGKAHPRSLTIKTPTSTIGIRGTDFIVTVAEKEGASDAR